jgi:hypothetical protein
VNRNSSKARRICVDTHAWINPLGRKCLTCHVCGCVIDLVATKPEHWRADHIERHAEGGRETAENLWPICIDCDSGTDGKAADDTRAVAKGKRMADRHDGVKIKKPFPKRPEGQQWGRQWLRS